MLKPGGFVSDVLVIGGGAAGLMAAIEAGRRGRRVTILEHSPEIGRKILISGGGRCNFTNRETTPANFLSRNPHFAKSALARYGPADIVALLEKHRIPYHEKTLGQLFCNRSARDVVDLLRKEATAAGVQVVTGCRVGEVRRVDGFAVDTSRGEFSAPALVVATGGLSIPKMGATDWGYRLARQFGLKIVETRPALVPLVFSTEDRGRFSELAGVSAQVTASAGGAEFREKMLFTHRGLSGPVILQASSYWHPGGEVKLDLAPGVEIGPELAAPKANPRAILARHMPRRLAERWLEAEGPQAAEELAQRVHSWTIRPAGTEGYAKAEVTAGGVDTDELSSKTMEARRVPGLYFVGEVVDVTGHLGGFNFQWAWASGYAAGQAV